MLELLRKLHAAVLQSLLLGGVHWKMGLAVNIYNPNSGWREIRR